MPSLRTLKSQAHDLKPVVMIGQKGLSKSVLEEIELALDHHELIKVKIAHERDDRKACTKEIVTKTKAQLVQSIGKIITLYRPKPR